MEFKLIVPRSISLGHCPNCNAVGSLDRVRVNNLFDKLLLKVLKIRSYHCRKCRVVVKFTLYKLRNNPGKVIGNYAIIVIIFTALIFLVNIVLKK